MSAFFSHLVGALIGLLIGIIYGEVRNGINRSQQRRAYRNQLAAAFRFNVIRIVQMQEQLSEKKVADAKPIVMMPNYLLDTDPIKVVLFSGREILATQAEFDDYNWQRYQLEHINTKLILISRDGIDPAILRDLRNHLSQVKTAIEDILSKLERNA